MKRTFNGRSTDAGVWAFSSKEKRALDTHVATLAGKDIVVTVREKRAQRSYDQLRYWFGMPMKLLSEKTGYTKMQQHSLCLAICFGTIKDERTGIYIPVVPASRHLTTAQFSELIEWCPPWAWETYEMQIPLPNDVDLDSLPGVSEDEAA